MERLSRNSGWIFVKFFHHFQSTDGIFPSSFVGARHSKNSGAVAEKSASSLGTIDDHWLNQWINLMVLDSFKTDSLVGTIFSDFLTHKFRSRITIAPRFDPAKMDREQFFLFLLLLGRCQSVTPGTINCVMNRLFPLSLSLSLSLSLFDFCFVSIF